MSQHIPGPTCIHGLNGPCRVCGDQTLYGSLGEPMTENTQRLQAVFTVAWDLEQLRKTCAKAHATVEGLAYRRATKSELEGIIRELDRAVDWAQRMIGYHLRGEVFATAADDLVSARLTTTLVAIATPTNDPLLPVGNSNHPQEENHV